MTAASERSREIAPGVHRIVYPVGQRLNSSYLLIGDRASVLFDLGTRGDVSQHVLPYLQELGLAPDRLSLAIISHGDVDHFGGAAELSRLVPGCVLACGSGDHDLVRDPELVVRGRYNELVDDGLGESAEFNAWCADVAEAAPVGLTLTGGEQVWLDADRRVEVLALPGHSLGHLGLWLPDARTVVIGDAALGRAVPLADGSIAFPPTYRHVAAYREAIARLRALEPQIVATAHYPLLSHEQAEEFLRSSREFTDELERELLAELHRAEEPVPLRGLAGRLADRFGPWPTDVRAAMGQPVIGHLEDLEHRGQVTAIRTGAERRWSSSGSE